MKNLKKKYTGRLEKRLWVSRVRPQILITWIVISIVTGFINPVNGQISIDNFNTAIGANGTTTTPINHLTGSGNNRLVIVAVSARDRLVSGVTYDGSPLTLLVSDVDNGVKAFTYIYFGKAPASGTKTVVVSHASLGNEHRVIVGVITFEGVDQTTPFNTHNTAHGANGTSGSVPLSSDVGEMVFAVLAIERSDQVSNVNPGQTSIWNISANTEVGADGPHGAGSQADGIYPSTTMNWSWTGNAKWSISGVAIREACNVSGSVAKTNISCNGLTDGTITVSSPTGGSGSYEYRLNAGAWQSSGSFTGLSANTYDVQIRDANAPTCANSLGNQTIIEPAILNAVVGSTDVTCFGANDGTITVSSPTGGWGTYEYRLNTGSWQSGGSFIGLSPNTYDVQIRDAAYPTCVRSLGSTAINEPAQLNATVSKTNISCNGLADGTITITSPTGGSGSYEYQLNTLGWQSSGSFAGLAANTYDVQIRDANEITCVRSLGNQIITDPTALSISLTSKTNVLCYGQSTGAVTVAGNGGTPPYKYSLDDIDYSNTNGIFSGLAANTHTFYVKDNNNCGPASLNVTITQPQDPLTVTPTLTQPSCSSLGSISLAVDGGTTPYTYDWADISGPSNPKDRIGLSPGSYWVTVTDNNGCFVSSGQLILNTPSGCVGITVCKTDLASPFSVTPHPDNVSYNWTIESLPTPGTLYPGIITGNGTPSITVDWSQVPVGGYEVCVVAQNVCGTTQKTCQTVYVNQAVATAQADPVCEGGTLYLFASGGGSYLWSGPNGFSSSSENPVIFNVKALTHDGTYYVTVTATSGCQATADVTVTVNATPDVTGVVTQSTCGNSSGSITLNPAGSYDYIWSNGSTNQNLTGLAAGNYSVTVTNASGCDTIMTFSVSDSDGPAVTATVRNINCYGGATGQITLDVTGGTAPLTFLWSDGYTGDNRSGLTAGTYSVLVTDALGCKGTASATITQPNPLFRDHLKVDISCKGDNTGSITLFVSGGTPVYEYIWSGPVYIGNIPNPTGLGVGTYYVTITDDSSCVIYDTITLLEPDFVLAASYTVTDVRCNGGSDGQVVLNPSGGTPPYAYSWSGPGPFSATTKDIVNIPAGTYNVTITDAKACQYILNDIEVDEPDVLTVDASFKTDVSCFGGADGTITLSVDGGTPDYAYLWSNGATTQNLSGLAIGTYTVTVTDSKGCIETASNTITQPTLLTASATPTAADCYGASTGSIVLTVNGGTPLPGSPPDDYTYLWSNNATSKDLSGIQAGNYHVTVTDSKGCTAQASATVNQPDPITVSAVVTNILCNSAATGAIDLSVGGGAGGFTYDWADLTPPPVEPDDRSDLTAGTYTVTITDVNNCQEVRSYTITQPTALLLSVTPSDISCYGGSDGSINLSVSGGTSPYTYAWSNSATTEDIAGLAAGSYNVTVTDANSCQAILSSITLSEPDELILNISVNKHVTCRGGADGSATANVSGGTPPYAYLWSTGYTGTTLSGLSAGTYTLVVTDANGCVANEAVIITQPADQIELYAIVRNTSWCASNTGSIDLLVVNGVGTLYFNWSNSETTEDISGLAAGSYSVTVTDGLGCTAELSNITVGTAPTMNVTVDTYDPSCFGNDGQAFAIVGGGVPPYTYLWSTTATSSNISGLGAGTYYVTVTDADLCWATASGSLTAPTCNPPVAVDDYFTTCGETLNETVADNDNLQGIPLSDMEFLPLTFPAPEQGTLDWGIAYDGSFTFIPTPGYNGTVEIRYLVEDTFGLSDEGKLIVYVSQVIAEITAANTSHVECGATDGSITVTHTGGIGTITYSIDDGANYQSSPTFSNLGAGTYTVKIRDEYSDANVDFSCETEIEVTILNVCLEIEKNLVSINSNPAQTKYNEVDDELEYEIFVTNTGTATLENIVVTDILPGVSVSGSPILSLAPSASTSLTASYTVVAADLVAKKIDNTAKAAFTYNGKSYEYSDSETVLMGDADVTITKSATPDPAIAGQALTYTITVTNNGPAAALNVTITDNPVHFSSPVYSLTGSDPWTPGTGSLNIGTLAPSQSYTIYLKDVVHPYECGPLSNTASVTTTSNDNIPGNNSSTISTNVTNSSPDAVDDNYTMEQNTAAAPTSLTANVFSNDSDFEGQPYAVSVWGSPSGNPALIPGTFSLTTNTNGVFTFIPPEDYVGTVTFTYEICDSCPGCDTASVTITIIPCVVPPPRPGAIIQTPGP